MTALTLLYVDDEHIPSQAEPRWTAGRSAYVETLDHAKHMHRPRHRLAYLWMFDALLASPDTIVAAVQAARDELVATDEALQPFAESLLPPSPSPLALCWGRFIVPVIGEC